MMRSIVQRLTDPDRSSSASLPGAGPSQARTAGGTGLETMRRLPFLAGVSEDALRRFAAHAQWRLLDAGQVVVDTYDASQEVFFVTEGTVRVVVRSAAGHELILNDLGAGEIFGELAAIDGVRRSANVTALVRARLCAVPGPAFMDLVLHCPAAGLRLLQLLATRLRMKDERALEATALPVRERLLAELLRLSRDRGDGERRVSPPPPQHVLAARLGLRRETVSRELARLARAGHLTMSRGALILHQSDRLRAGIDLLLRQTP